MECFCAVHLAAVNAYINTYNSRGLLSRAGSELTTKTIFEVRARKVVGKNGVRGFDAEGYGRHKYLRVGPNDLGSVERSFGRVFDNSPTQAKGANCVRASVCHCLLF